MLTLTGFLILPPTSEHPSLIVYMSGKKFRVEFEVEDLFWKVWMKLKQLKKEIVRDVINYRHSKSNSEYIHFKLNIKECKISKPKSPSTDQGTPVLCAKFEHIK